MAAARETAQVEYTEEELLTNHDYAEPLVAGGVAPEQDVAVGPLAGHGEVAADPDGPG